MDNFFLFLNTLIKRVVLGEFTMWLIFLFIGFAFIPVELVAYLNPKTPAFFPDWFSLSNMASVIFSLVALMIWLGVKDYAKKIYAKYRKQGAENAERKRLVALFNDLPNLEWSIITQVFLRDFIDTSDLPTKLALERLKEQKLVSFSYVFNRLEVNPLLVPVVRQRIESMLAKSA